MTFIRMNDVKDRERQIVVEATLLAATHGYRAVTRDMVAKAVGCSTGLITHRFGTMPQLRRAVMRYAIRHAVLAVIAQGLAAGDPHARKAPDELKQKALAALA